MSTDTPRRRDEHIRQDVQDLHRLGYAQQFFREIGGFSNFALSFSIISHRNQPVRLRSQVRWPNHQHAGLAVAVLTLALLNPVLCILHCAWAHAHPAAFTDDDQSLFLCDLAHTPQFATTPFEQVWDGPRAVYEMTPLIVFGLTLIMLSFSVGPGIPPHPPQHMTSPSVPPPKDRIRFPSRLRPASLDVWCRGDRWKEPAAPPCLAALHIDIPPESSVV